MYLFCNSLINILKREIEIKKYVKICTIGGKKIKKKDIQRYIYHQIAWGLGGVGHLARNYVFCVCFSFFLKASHFYSKIIANSEIFNMNDQFLHLCCFFQINFN